MDRDGAAVAAQTDLALAIDATLADHRPVIAAVAAIVRAVTDVHAHARDVDGDLRARRQRGKHRGRHDGGDGNSENSHGSSPALCLRDNGGTGLRFPPKASTERGFLFVRAVASCLRASPSPLRGSCTAPTPSAWHLTHS